MASDPRVTVLMSVYNGERYLREAIDSILEQTYRGFEFVIYDDCSTDSSPEIVASYDDPRIVYRRTETNQGLTRNLADGVSRARGVYIARMDADDIALPERLSQQVAWMDQHPEIAILGSPVVYFNENGDKGVSEAPQDDAAIKARLFCSFTMLHPTIMIRRDALLQAGLNYDPAYRCSQDHALYFDSIRAGLEFAQCPEPLLRMRAHGGSISRAKHGKQRECSFRTRENFLSRTGLSAGCTRQEIEAYNFFAHGELPTEADSVRALASFAGKIFANPIFEKYFSLSLARRDFANSAMLWAYQNVRTGTGRAAALEVLNTPFVQWADAWPLKLRIKFLIKRMLSYVA